MEPMSIFPQLIAWEDFFDIQKIPAAMLACLCRKCCITCHANVQHRKCYWYHLI